MHTGGVTSATVPSIPIKLRQQSVEPQLRHESVTTTVTGHLPCTILAALSVKRERRLHGAFRDTCAQNTVRNSNAL
jgi:hypothetical protein